MLDRIIKTFTLMGVGIAVIGMAGVFIWGTAHAPYFLAAVWTCFAVQLVSVIFAMVSG